MDGSKDKLVIIGDGETAKLAYDYFASSSDYTVVAFSAEGKFTSKKTLLGLPVVPFENLQEIYNPKEHAAFIAVSFTQFNRLRTRLYQLTKSKGYSICSLIHPTAVIGSNVQLGENCFILENVSIQRGAKIGNNVTFWSGCTVGHSSRIADNCFFSEHVAIAGFCTAGENCFFGINSCVAGNLEIAKDTIIGAGAVVIRNTAEGKIYVGNPAKPLPNRGVERFIINEESI